MDNYKNLLQNHPIVRRLTFIQLLSYFGAWFSNVAIYALLIELNVSATLIAVIAALHFLPGALLAPFSGALIDSVNPKRLMLGLLAVEIISTLFLLTIQSSEDIYLLYLLIVVRMGAASVYFTAEMSLLPKLLNGTELKTANELHSMIWSFCYTVGMAVSGLFVYGFGIKAAFVVDALLFLLSFFLLFSLKIDVSDLTKPLKKIWGSMKEGVIYIQSHPRIIYLLILHAAVGFTAFDALVALMAKTVYPEMSAALAIGFIHAVRAVALVIGPMLLAQWINDRRLLSLFFIQGAAIMLWGMLYHHYYLGLIGAFVTGFFTTTLWSYTYTMIQNSTDADYYGRVLAYNDMIFLSVSAFISYIIGVLFDNLGVSIGGILGLMGFLFMLTALFYRYYLQKYAK